LGPRFDIVAIEKTDFFGDVTEKLLNVAFEGFPKGPD
jgi:hypothetical protein